MVTPRTAAALRPPLQERSRRNLERVLAATKRLLLERPFDAIGVADVVARADRLRLTRPRPRVTVAPR
jgi:AcrR family transcriptional regulator